MDDLIRKIRDEIPAKGKTKKVKKDLKILLKKDKKFDANLDKCGIKHGKKEK